MGLFINFDMVFIKFAIPTSLPVYYFLRTRKQNVDEKLKNFFNA